jgi:hypothetical protein
MQKITYQTKHFQSERMQQRGVPVEFPELAKLFGKVTTRDATTNCVYFSNKSLCQMKKAGVAKRLIIEVEDRQDIRFIVSKENGALITVEYPYEGNRRFKRDTKSFTRAKELH